VHRTSDPTRRDAALHETRKAAKRLRYAAESAVPVFGGRAKKLARRAERVQVVLGEHQDTVVARQTLRELGAQAYLHDENGFTFGRLHALEQARAEELMTLYPTELDRLPARRLDRWLDG
jgi:CHAD domain-containing protein